ncbi:DUF488 family protein [Rubellimicrobium mesophilum]|uniref:DUF488 domain-containing protein n=1 Tax=Rubellimicrobium mesophilum TaxID=1123067 RepID=UPI0014705ABE|nr:DUF488 domain-containing protein [Rubellimicrobium mesophilum]
MQGIYTVGHGTRSFAEIQELLRARECDFLVDVRSSPFSKFNPDFNIDQLRRHTASAGITYVFMGDQLGGRPNDPQIYDKTGKIDYQQLRCKEYFQAGLERLETAAKKDLHVCIMCSEERPEDCHRSKLIGAELQARGINVTHIDKAGQNSSQIVVIERIASSQLDLFSFDPALTRSRGRYKR